MISRCRWSYLVAALLPLAATSCTHEPPCGTGTVDKNGTCVGSAIDRSQCAPGTVFMAGLCLPLCGSGTTLSSDTDAGCVASTSLCGPNTKVVLDDGGGGFTCVGIGGGSGDAGCGEAGVDDAGHCRPACKAPTCGSSDYGSGTVCLVGRALDADGLKPIDGAAESLHAYAYNPLAFVNCPTGTPSVGDAPVDSCGYYKIANVKTNFSGDMAVAIKPTTSPGNYVFTGVAFLAPSAGKVAITDLNVPVVSVAEDASWSTMAGLSGTTFSQEGAILVEYHKAFTPDGGEMLDKPIGGVVPTLGGTPVAASQAFYFSDPWPKIETVVKGTTSNMTQAGNGYAIITGVSSTSELSGQGPGSTTWDSNLAASPAGLYFVTTRNGM